MNKTVYKVVYFDECTESYEDWTGEIDNYEEARKLLRMCIEQEADCYIAERVYCDGAIVWEES